MPVGFGSLDHKLLKIKNIFQRTATSLLVGEGGGGNTTRRDVAFWNDRPQAGESLSADLERTIPASIVYPRSRFRLARRNRP